MTTSDGSSSLTVDVTVSSESFKEIKLRDLDLYRSLNPDDIVFSVNPSRLVIRDELTGKVSLGAMSLVSITNNDVVKILEKIEKIVMNNTEGMSHRLDSLFVDKKDRKWTGPSPGTLRIFGPDLVCFYTGRGWRKIKLGKK